MGVPLQKMYYLIDQEADIGKTQELLVHDDVSTTRLYARRKSRYEHSPNFNVN